jgi:hypothetical protein
MVRRRSTQNNSFDVRQEHLCEGAKHIFREAYLQTVKEGDEMGGSSQNGTQATRSTGRVPSVTSSSIFGQIDMMEQMELCRWGECSRDQSPCT